MFKGFAQLRTILTSNIFLRRISRELHQTNIHLARANELKEIELQLAHPARYKAIKSSKAGHTGKLVQISVASVEDWNAAYAELHPDLDSDAG